MNRKKFILLIIGILFLCSIELYIEKIIIQKKIQNNFKLKNLFINYSFQKSFNKEQTENQLLTKTFFLLYPELHFVIIKKKNQIVFAASKNIEYNEFLASFMNTLRSDKILKNNLKIKNNYFYFISSKIDEYSTITSFRYHLNFLPAYLRNSIILLLLAGLLIYKLKRNKKTVIESYSRPNELDVIEENKKELFNSNAENYKNLYEDNQKLIEQIENLSTFREVGLAINSILNFNQMLHVIMGVVINKMGVQKTVVYFIDENNKELLAKIGREGNTIILEDDLLDDKIVLGKDSLGQAMEYHTSIILSENSNGHFLVCPLIAKGNLIGAIKVANRPEGNTFEEKEQSLLKLLSSQIAIALNNARLYELAITDGLTKLYVHRHFQHRLQEELLRHKRNERTLSLIMIDIDHFKNFNDEYGHQTGDFVLTKTAKILKSLFRTTDNCFRYGGEEMSIILPETDPDNAYTLAEKSRETINNQTFEFKGNKLNITISLGVSTYDPKKEFNLSKEKLIKMADEALYFSKQNGRNRTTVHETIHETEINNSPKTANMDTLENTDNSMEEKNSTSKEEVYQINL